MNLEPCSESFVKALLAWLGLSPPSLPFSGLTFKPWLVLSLDSNRRPAILSRVRLYKSCSRLNQALIVSPIKTHQIQLLYQLILLCDFLSVLAPYSSTSMMNMFWSFFVSSLSKQGIPDYVLRVYRSKFFLLPWQSFLPTLHNMQLMQEVCQSLVTNSFHILRTLLSGGVCPIISNHP